MFPIYALFLPDNGTIKENMEVNLGDFAYIIITLISVGVAYGILQGKQKEMERRIDTLEKMIDKQIDVDNGIKEAINNLTVQLAQWQSSITEQVKNLRETLNRNDVN